MSRFALFFSFLLCTLLLGAVQQPSSGASQATASQSNMANQAESTQMKRFNSTDEAKSLQGDIRKMRALVNQMEANLSFVDSTQSPLKHQFQLEIDTWRTVIDQMERRAQANAR